MGQNKYRGQIADIPERQDTLSILSARRSSPVYFSPPSSCLPDEGVQVTFHSLPGSFVTYTSQCLVGRRSHGQ